VQWYLLIESKIHSSDASPKLLRDPPFHGRIQTTFLMYTVVISLHIHADSNYTSHRVYLADGVGPQHTSFPQCPLAPIHPRPVQSSHRRKNLLSNSNIRPPKTTNPRTPKHQSINIRSPKPMRCPGARKEGDHTKNHRADRAFEFLLLLQFLRWLSTLRILLLGEFGVAFALFWCLRLVVNSSALLSCGRVLPCHGIFAESSLPLYCLEE